MHCLQSKKAEKVEVTFLQNYFLKLKYEIKLYRSGLNLDLEHNIRTFSFVKLSMEIHTCASLSPRRQGSVTVKKKKYSAVILDHFYWSIYHEML